MREPYKNVKQAKRDVQHVLEQAVGSHLSISQKCRIVNIIKDFVDANADRIAREAVDKFFENVAYAKDITIGEPPKV